VLIMVNLLFTFSFWLDIQILEGALTASRFVGFHLIDLNSALQVMLAHKHIITNLVIGTGTVFVLWLLLGGRTFCSWVCPYHLVAEWRKSCICAWLAKKKLVTDQAMHRGLRTVFWLAFALCGVGHRLHGVRGHFADRHPVARLDLRAGAGPALGGWHCWSSRWFYSRRAWCRYACPIGLTYGVVGVFSPVRVKYNTRGLLPRRRLQEGLPGAPCARHRDQGPGCRCRSSHRTRLHTLRPVRRYLPHRFAHF
jgi:ferredoxin-type protein NapH